AFELPGSSASDAANSALFAALLERAAPLPPSLYGAGGYLPVVATVPGSIVPTPIQLDIHTASDAQFIASSPTPGVRNANELQWQRNLSAPEIFIAKATLHLGDSTQTLSLAA